MHHTLHKKNLRLEALEGTDALEDGAGKVVSAHDDKHRPEELEDTSHHEGLAIGLEQYLWLDDVTIMSQCPISQQVIPPTRTFNKLGLPSLSLCAANAFSHCSLNSAKHSSESLFVCIGSSSTVILPLRARGTICNGETWECVCNV